MGDAASGLSAIAFRHLFGFAGADASLPLFVFVSFAEMGFAVALGVLLDTLIVRSVLVTALTLDVGRRMWWPSALAKKADPEDLKDLALSPATTHEGAMSGAERRARID